MQDMLVPIFGENGAIIVQYAITLAVIVVLIALVVWGIRHYGGSTVRPAVRGRLPRLAIIDTLPVDNKRKLVLLRRDNVEHLVLIGGPSDVVVESSVVRQRVAQRPGHATATRPATAAAAASAAMAAGPVAPEPAPAEPPPIRVAVAGIEPSETTTTATGRRSSPGGSEPAATERVVRSYPPSRGPAARAARASATAETSREGFRSRRAQAAQAAMPDQETMHQEPMHEPATEHHLPLRPAPAPRHEPAPSRFAPLPDHGPDEMPDESREPPNGPVPGYESVAEDEHHDAVSAFAPRAYDEEQGTGLELAESGDESHEIEVPAAPPTADAEPPHGAERQDGGNELEEEMARLLGQISTPRQEQN